MYLSIILAIGRPVHTCAPDGHLHSVMILDAV